jgi:HSP20 family molecular chaperone IbpA
VTGVQTCALPIYEFDGLTAKAEIKNGLLHIVVDKKEDQKPKKLEIKFK